MSAIWIRGGRLIDPVAGTDAIGDLFVFHGRLAHPPVRPPEGTVEIDAHGCMVAPALIDIHVHLREPGNEEAETISSGTRAAASGGFGTVVAMPNTQPPLDRPERIRQQIEKACEAGFAVVKSAACITRDRAGHEVAPLNELAAAGAAVFTDDGSTVTDYGVMREAMRRAAALGRPIMDHAQEQAAQLKGCMHEGAVSRRFGLPGIPSEAEVRVVERDIRLARETGCALHIQHLSTRGAARLVHLAREEGLPVTAEVTPHHLALCDEDLLAPDPNYKMNPPLRSRSDREALRQAVLDKTVTCLATDHAPHTEESKARGMLLGPFGVVGLETAVGVTYSLLVKEMGMGLIDWVRAWTTGPAAVLGLDPPTLKPGHSADLTIIDVNTPWVVQPERFVSKSRNTPFANHLLHGRALCTLHAGRVVWESRG